MKMNAELRHKQNVLQTQLKSSVERKADMEADLKEKSKEIENLQAQLDTTNSNSPVCSCHCNCQHCHLQHCACVGLLLKSEDIINTDNVDYLKTCLY